MTAWMDCLLPGGYVEAEGQVHGQVVLSPLSGFAEKLIAENPNASPPVLVTAILGQCVRRIGSIEPVSEETVRRLLVGDRQYLLLKLREITFGKEVRAVINCPWPDCGERVDMDFSTVDIPVKESRQTGLFHELALSDASRRESAPGRTPERVIFRLPNGKDQELIAPFVDRDEFLAAGMLLERCIQSPDAGCGPDKIIAMLSPLARLEIEQAMNRLSPGVELTMQAMCPECGREFTAPFDLQAFFLGELHTRLDLIFREVHYLAYHYHWSESDILGMTRKDRRRYIEVLSDEIEQLNHAVRR